MALGNKSTVPSFWEIKKRTGNHESTTPGTDTRNLCDHTVYNHSFLYLDEDLFDYPSLD